MDITNLPEFDDHELVSFISDTKTGLRGFIAIHNTNLGSATGGTRYWHYTSELEALKDVLRLSRAMTYKCALAGVPYGGSKAVIISNDCAPKNEKFLKSYARRINLFNGTLRTGEDVGINQKDVDTLSKYSPYIIGSKKLAGDPGPWAALGVFNALCTTLKEVFGNEDLHNRTIAIQGLGKVGFGVAKLAYARGAKIVAADLKADAVRAARRNLKNIKIVSPGEIHKQKVDVYSPNALGGVINERTINEFRCSIICGGANNQLKSNYYGNALHRLGILYVPDYVANAGGLINVVAELDTRGYSKNRVLKKTIAIRGTVKKIIALSKKKKKPTNEIADELAQKIFLRPSK